MKKTLRKLLAPWCWSLLTLLAVLLAPSVRGQGIVYVHLPLSNPNGDPNHLPWDSLGTQVGPDLSIIISGQTVLTFTSGPLVLGQPTQFAVQPSSLSAVIALQPFPDFPDNVWGVALSQGQEIDPAALGYGWFGADAGAILLASSIGSGTVENPWLTGGYFAGVESAYIGFSFQQAGQTHYGWLRAGSPVVGLNAGWVYDYAYQTEPNTPIFAGQGVPEPGIATLFILGVIACKINRRN